MLTCSIKTLVRRKTAAENSNLEEDPQKYISHRFTPSVLYKTLSNNPLQREVQCK